MYTGDGPGAGTEAEVSALLVGARGDTGRRRLLAPSPSNPASFQAGQLDVFYVEAVDLSGVEKVIIGHNGHGKGIAVTCSG